MRNDASNTWTTDQRIGLFASDLDRAIPLSFVLNPALPGPFDSTDHPDFSSSGAPITFGYQLWAFSGASCGVHCSWVCGGGWVASAKG